MKKIYTSVFFVMNFVLVFAQSNTGIGAKVVDSKTFKPLQNVVASIQNTNLTELTDINGKFVFKNVPVGKGLLQLRSNGYKDQLMQIDIENGKIQDIGTIQFVEDITEEQQLSLITITENDLGDDNSGSESTAGLLQASRDAFQQSAAFNWGQARFRIRGLDNEYGTTMINGIVMNKIYDGRPQFGNWGGLNDVTRNQEFTNGSSPSDYTFGGILGTQEINTRASIYRPGTRISASGTNTNYSWRLMGTHASGMQANGWAYVISAGRRWAQEGYFEGTDYSANSLFASVEKKINDHHSINFTSMYAQNRRGKSSANSQEVTDLLGVKYNSYWGFQNGKKRNSRDKDVAEPINILSHYWKINSNTNLNTTVSYQTGSIANSRLENPGGNNLDPTYYRNLPSYGLNYHTLAGVWLPNYAEADKLRNKFLSNTQLDWLAAYDANTKTSSGQNAYILSEQRNDDEQFTANSIFNTKLSDNITMNGGVAFKSLKSHNYAIITDLLGGSYALNVDSFYSGDRARFDLNNPNTKVVKDDIFGYNYNLIASTIDAFTQFKFNYKKVDFYLAQSYTQTESQREGLFRNGNYAKNSFGKSQNVKFENFGFKGGLTYKISGRTFLDFNGAYLTKAPNLRNTFSNARNNNNITPDLVSESIFSIDGSYILRFPKFKARLTGYMSKINNSTELSFFYAENISDSDGDEDSFVSEILTGVNKKNIGAELGIEYQVTSTLELAATAAFGQYTYDSNPNLKINDDAQAINNPYPITDFGKSYLKNYYQPGTPQKAYSIGIEYRDPKFWWIGANANYLAENYLDVSNTLRTDNFTINDVSGVAFDGATPETVKNILKQEKFDDIKLVNLSGGKSWRVKGNTIGVFVTVNNVLDTTYKTGGFEQSRKATYPDLLQDSASGTRGFGPKYFYGYGRTYFVNFYVNF